MTAHASILQALLEVLLKEEALLHALIEQAARERQALIDSDFSGLAEVTGQMVRTASELEEHERAREGLLAEMGSAEATISELAPGAQALGVEGFAEARERLLQRAEELRAAQEQNAALLLAAATLRERWFRLLTGMAAPTYGAHGEQRSHDQRFVSRTA